MFLGLTTRSQLAAWLSLTDKRLRYILYVVPNNLKYQRFEIAKKHGGTREIQAPSKALKAIQRKIANAITEVSKPSGIAKGFISGKSILDHATLHRSKKWVILADIKDFFPSINFGRVRGAFMARPFNFSPQVATVLAQLCCTGGALPQGAPTSPAISNLICRSLDRDLVKLAKMGRCSVSRFADDICFSTNTRSIPVLLAIALLDGKYTSSHELQECFRLNGFTLNAAKFHVQDRRSRQMVTGIVVNRGLSMPRYWRRQIRTVLHLLKTHGSSKTLEIVRSWRRTFARHERAEVVEQVIRGKVGFAHWLDKKANRSFVNSLHSGYRSLRRLFPRIAPLVAVRVMAEGPSDLLHLEAALKHFQLRGEFQEIKPKFNNFAGDTGDHEVMATVRRIAKVDVDELTIAVFDCDNKRFMKDNLLEVGAITRLGRRVFALCLAPPDAGLASDFCIECLYDRAQATAVTSEGRRLFFRDEFDESSGLDSTGLYRRQFPKQKGIVVSDKVTRVSDGQSALLSKVDFATLVLARSDPFYDLDFSGFLPTLELLRESIDSI